MKNKFHYAGPCFAIAMLTACGARTPSADTTSTAEAAAAPVADTGVDLKQSADIKLKILQLLEGSYDQACAKTVGDEFPKPNSGSPIHIMNNGTVDWGFGSINAIAHPASEFGLVVGHSDSMVASKFDIVDMQTQERLVVFGVSVPISGGDPGATVTDSRPEKQGGKSLGALCVGTQKPKAQNADLWSVAAKIIPATSATMDCIHMGTYAQSKLSVSFSGEAITVGSYTLKSNQPRKAENMSVDDYSANNVFFTFAVSDAAGNQVSVFMTKDKMVGSVQWQQPDNSIVSCSR